MNSTPHPPVMFTALHMQIPGPLGVTPPSMVPGASWPHSVAPDDFQFPGLPLTAGGLLSKPWKYKARELTASGSSLQPPWMGAGI